MLHLGFSVFVLFLALSYFNISIGDILTSPAGQENLGYLAAVGDAAWHWFLLNAVH